jgi:RNA polymerase sigma factor (sigma-70 family)
MLNIMNKTTEITTIEVPDEFKEYIDMVRRVAHAYPTNPRCDFEDYVNVGLAALAQAKISYDPDNKTGAKFSTYAFPFVKNAIEKEFQATANAISGCTPYFINKGEAHREAIRFINNTTVSLSISRKDLDSYNLLPSHNPSPKRMRPSLKEIIVESGTNCPETSAERGELIDKIDSIIADLDADEQDIIYRRVFHEDTFQEIADAKKLTWRTVNYRFHKCMDKLRDKLLEAGLEVYA